MIRAGYYIKTFLLSAGNYLGICVAEGIAHADPTARVSGLRTDMSNNTRQWRYLRSSNH
jgi:hypothetical protein